MLKQLYQLMRLDWYSTIWHMKIAKILAYWNSMFEFKRLVLVLTISPHQGLQTHKIANISVFRLFWYSTLPLNRLVGSRWWNLICLKRWITNENHFWNFNDTQQKEHNNNKKLLRHSWNYWRMRHEKNNTLTHTHRNAMQHCKLIRNKIVVVFSVSFWH